MSQTTDDSPSPTEHDPLADRTAFQRDVCWVLDHRGPSKGVAIKADLGEYYGQDVNHGRLSPNLDDLVEAGLVEKGQRDERTNEYRLSESGRRALEARLVWQTDGDDQ